MKAIVLHKHGGPEQLRYEDIDTPQPGPGQLLISIKSIGLNHFDIDCRNGISGYDFNLPHIMGCEGAGVVAEVGPGVSQFKVGDHVIPILTINFGACNKRVCNCLLGRDNICHQFDKLGVSRWGTYAEYCLIEERNTIHMPQGLSFQDAAGGQVAFTTAWEMMVNKGRVRAGEEVLVNAAGSGVGSACVQVAALHGARIIATAGSDEKLERARAQGAEVTINYNTQDVVAEVMKATDGRGVDLVMEMVGGKVLQQSHEAVTLGGRIVVCGAHAGEKVELDMIQFFRKEIEMSSVHFAPRASNAAVLNMIAEGRLQPIIHKQFELADMGSAHQVLESRNFYGKIVINT